MPRPKCCCKVRGVPAHRLFRPHGTDEPPSDQVVLLLEELEAVRLADLNGLYQEQAAPKMGISRSAFARILESARRKLADALIHGKCLRLEGGPVLPGQGRAGVCPRDCPCRRKDHRP